VSTLQTEMTSAKQDISSRYTKTEVDNKLKNKVEVNDLESGRYGGDFYPLTGREAFYLWNLATTTAAANLYLNPDPAISSVLRSTSSIRYKHSVETIDSEHADLIFRMRPVWYRSQCENDRRDWGFYGLIAEEVGEIAPQFVHWRPAKKPTRKIARKQRRRAKLTQSPARRQRRPAKRMPKPAKLRR
ncbi:hypothetical protein WG9_02224, partial [Escherichia coli KTE39]